MYNFFCKPLRYSFVIMHALQKNTNILVKTKHFYAYTTQQSPYVLCYKHVIYLVYSMKNTFFSAFTKKIADTELICYLVDTCAGKLDGVPVEINMTEIGFSNTD